MRRFDEEREIVTMEMVKTSRYISLILRHRPEVIGISLDENGWADVDQLIQGVNMTHFLNRELLEEIVNTDSKQRYAFNEDKTKIRANQGHSISVDVGLKPVEPPEILYHGTGESHVSSIDSQGLLAQSRLFVHLSSDVETAEVVGARHGKPVIYQVLSGRMVRGGYEFYRSVNGVWLTKEVPVPYLRKL